MSEIVIARRSGAVYDENGERIFIRAGRTVADADHPLVKKYPKAWATVNVSLRTDGRTETAEVPEGAQDTIYAEADPQTVELAQQFERLAVALRDLDAL